MALVLDSRSDLTLDALHQVAWAGAKVRFSDAAIEVMTAARERFMHILDNDPDVTIYGVTSGYGQMAKKRLTPEERKVHARHPPIAPAASWGDPVPERVKRAIVFARLANFVEGDAAISPDVAQAVAAMLDGAALPDVPAKGQGGAGEILALTHLFVDLCRGIELAEKDSLSLVNGSPCGAALACDSALAAHNRLRVAAEVLALAAEAFNAPLGHFDAALERQWNNAHDAWALRSIRALISGGSAGDRRPYQAPVSFRILPRILGQAHRAVTWTKDVAAESLAAVTDNPLLLPPDDEQPYGTFISNGGFHNAQAPMVMDAVSCAYANLCVLAERMGAKLLDGAVSLLPDNLVTGETFADMREGYLGCLAMAATGYEEEARLYAHASLLPGSESGGFGQNDVASPVFLAWTKQAKAGECLDMALATLAPIALRALRITDRKVPDALESLAAHTHEALPGLDNAEPNGPRVARLAETFQARIYGALIEDAV